jgi:hypothetical protein
MNTHRPSMKHTWKRRIEFVTAGHEADGRNTNSTLPAKSIARYNHPPPGVIFPLAHKRRNRKLTSSTMAKGETPTPTPKPKPTPCLTPLPEKRLEPQKRRQNPTARRISKQSRKSNKRGFWVAIHLTRLATPRWRSKSL